MDIKVKVYAKDKAPSGTVGILFTGGTVTDNRISTNNYHFRHFLYKIFLKNP